jgi:hypothetical protein
MEEQRDQLRLGREPRTTWRRRTEPSRRSRSQQEKAEEHLEEAEEQVNNFKDNIDRSRTT